MNYDARPIDTTKVFLPRDILELTEYLAENTHDIWAKQRLSEGWTYGPERDDMARQHPDLVPYDQLSDSERGWGDFHVNLGGYLTS